MMAFIRVHCSPLLSSFCRIYQTNNQIRGVICNSRNLWSSISGSYNTDSPQQSLLHTQSNHRCLCGAHSTQLVTAARYISTSNITNAKITQGAFLRTEEDSTIVKFLDKIGISWKFRYNRLRMRNAAQNLYTSCADGVDVQHFIKACGMEDTLFSWFLVTELHVWMSMVRLKQEGREGRYVIHYIVWCMWQDAEARGKSMGISSIKMKNGIKQMLYHFQAALFAYDEGILSDDRVLAAALWRTFFIKQCDDPRQVELMVEYVRQQVQYLDTLKSDELLQRGRIKWLPLKADIPVDTEEPKKVTVEEQLNLNH